MFEIIQFVFSSFWRWLGMLIIIATIAEGLGGFIRVNINKEKK